MQLTGWELIGWLAKTDYIGDATGTFINRNSFATYVNMGLMVALALLAEPFLAARGLGDVKRIAAQSVEHLLSEKTLLMLTLVVLAMASLQSHSRGGLLSAGLAVMVVIFIVFLVTRPRPVVALGVVAVTLLLGWGVLMASGGITLERLGQIDANYDVERRGRLTFWQVSLGMVGERPWQGYGYGSFEPAFAQHRDERFDLVVDLAHDTYIEHLVELGMPATVAALSRAGAAVRLLPARAVRAAAEPGVRAGGGGGHGAGGAALAGRFQPADAGGGGDLRRPAGDRGGPGGAVAEAGTAGGGEPPGLRAKRRRRLRPLAYLR